MIKHRKEKFTHRAFGLLFKSAITAGYLTDLKYITHSNSSVGC